MKKMWMIAAVACAALMISCGGEKKSENVEAKATAYATQMAEAMKSGDQAKIEKLGKEMNAWGKTLSKDELKVAEAAADKVMQEYGLR